MTLDASEVFTHFLSLKNAFELLSLTTSWHVFIAKTQQKLQWRIPRLTWLWTWKGFESVMLLLILCGVETPGIIFFLLKSKAVEVCISIEFSIYQGPYYNMDVTVHSYQSDPCHCPNCDNIEFRIKMSPCDKDSVCKIKSSFSLFIWLYSCNIHTMWCL